MAHCVNAARKLLKRDLQLEDKSEEGEPIGPSPEAVAAAHEAAVNALELNETEPAATAALEENLDAALAVAKTAISVGAAAVAVAAATAAAEGPAGFYKRSYIDDIIHDMVKVMQDNECDVTACVGARRCIVG